jgi:hypothetical protein
VKKRRWVEIVHIFNSYATKDKHGKRLLSVTSKFYLISKLRHLLKLKLAYWHRTFVAVTLYIATVESSLFVGDQCSWISWATLTHEFTSPQTYIYFFFKFHKYYSNCILYMLSTKLSPHEPVKFWLPTNIDPHELK